MRYEFSDGEWATIRPMLPNKARGVPRVDDRRILNGVFWVAVRRAVARPTERLRSLYHVLQPLCALATRRSVGPDHRRARRCP